MCEKVYDFKMVALTLDKGRAHDDRGNPISHIERWGLCFDRYRFGITIAVMVHIMVSYL